MAKFKFSDIEDAFMFVGSAAYGMNSALLFKDRGRFFIVPICPELTRLKSVMTKRIATGTSVLRCPTKTSSVWEPTWCLISWRSICPKTMIRSGGCFVAAAHIPGIRAFWNGEGCFKNGTTSKTGGKNRHSANGAKKTT